MLPWETLHEQFLAPRDPESISTVRINELMEAMQITIVIIRINFGLNDGFSLELPSWMLFMSHWHSLVTFIFSLLMATLWGRCDICGDSINCTSTSSSLTVSTGSFLNRWNEGFITIAPRKSLRRLGLDLRLPELGRCGILVSSTVQVLCAGILVSSIFQALWGWTLPYGWRKAIVKLITGDVVKDSLAFGGRLKLTVYAS